MWRKFIFIGMHLFLFQHQNWCEKLKECEKYKTLFWKRHAKTQVSSNELAKISEEELKQKLLKDYQNWILRPSSFLQTHTVRPLSSLYPSFSRKIVENDVLTYFFLRGKRKFYKFLAVFSLFHSSCRNEVLKLLRQTSGKLLITNEACRAG